MKSLSGRQSLALALTRNLTLPRELESKIKSKSKSKKQASVLNSTAVGKGGGSAWKSRIIPYNPKLKERARQLRKQATRAEKRLWCHLKGTQICGCDFDRQRPIDEYIVDFFCRELMLAIEIDGSRHVFIKELDDRRQRRLESLGVRFLRFWNYEVLNETQSVLERIEKWISEHERGIHPPSPSQEGE